MSFLGEIEELARKKASLQSEFSAFLGKASAIALELPDDAELTCDCESGDYGSSPFDWSHVGYYAGDDDSRIMEFTIDRSMSGRTEIFFSLREDGRLLVDNERIPEDCFSEPERLASFMRETMEKGCAPRP